MILTGSEITNEVQEGRIKIDPFEPGLLNPNSYNYRLGKTLIVIDDPVIDIRCGHGSRVVTIPESGYRLEPHKLYLGSTYEKIGSNTYVISLIGRSSLGRLGLFLQITADLGHLGTEHCWTLELMVVQPLVVYSGMRIGQVSFWATESLDLEETSAYLHVPHSYAQFSHPQPALVHKFF